MNIDGGEGFGKWSDAISKLIYFDCMPYFLKDLKQYKSVADLGGGNGNLKRFIPDAKTIDIDITKKPDVLADITEYKGEHDLLVIRYVLHYLDKAGVEKLLANIKSYHKGKVLLIQFVNDNGDIDIKRINSINENKHFLMTRDLFGYIKAFNILDVKYIEYRVTKEFYINRLKNSNAIEHNEKCFCILFEV